MQDICIYVTDGLSNVDDGQTLPEARLLSNAGVAIIAVGIGVDDQRELQAIASQSRFVINVASFDDLDDLALRMAHPLCASTGECQREIRMKPLESIISIFK